MLAASTATTTTTTTTTAKPASFMAEAIHHTAHDLSTKIFTLQDDWDHGNTSLNNEIWFAHLIPSVKRAVTLTTRKGKHQAALGILVGLLVFMNYDAEGWLHDQKVYLQAKEFTRFFEKLQIAWKSVLAQTDAELGINATARVDLIKALRTRELKVFDDFDVDIQVNIVEDDGSPDSDDDNEDEDDEDGDEEEDDQDDA
ncbi:hypothetical protein HDU99_000677 [Rhizoclosmatium hyalinum]|nr:hypothetical protein HDU99_000677 [Rhizoclosmatium hyalinum]